ncbi:MAG: dTMP kinase [Candidatus Micrarchaeaceae archaeon]
MRKGRFFVIEGVDGSGKSTQADNFTRMLRRNGIDAVLTEEPWYEDSIGKQIKNGLFDGKSLSAATIQLLFVANRSNHVEKVIDPALELGKTVVCSRYWMSTAVYGSAFCNGTKFDMKYFMGINSVFTKPDAVFFMDVAPETAYKRLERHGKKLDRFEKLEFIKIQDRKYNELKRLYRGLWINIDGQKDAELVTKKMFDKYRRIFG